MRPTPTAAPTTCGGMLERGRRRRCAATVRCCRACSSGCTPWSTSRPTTARTRRPRWPRPAHDGMAKGEVLVCHVVDTGDAARIIAVERYPT